jgi:hypothetical protein
MRAHHVISGSFLCLLIASSATLTGAQAKPQTKSTVKPGVVSGRVFLITVAGDLKPARMAKVYLLYMYRSVAYAEAHEEDQNSAAMAWMKAYNKALEDGVNGLKEKSAAPGYHYNEAVECLGKLTEYSRALTETLDWVSTNKKEWQIVTGQADEEGNFRISVPRPGDYDLFIDGHAGFNDAVWETHPLTVKPGTETTVKIGSPEVACVQTGN